MLSVTPPPSCLRVGLLAALLTTPVLRPAPPVARQAPRIPGLASYTLQDLGLSPARASRAGGPAVLVVDVDGLPYTLDLRVHSLRAPGFRLLEIADGREVEHAPPPVSTYRGEVYGPEGDPVPGARALGALDERGWSLALDLPGRERILVQPLAELLPEAGIPGAHVVHSRADQLPDRLHRCGVGDESAALGLPGVQSPTAGHAQATTGRLVTELAFDADVEFFRQNRSDVNATLRDIERVMNVVRGAYERHTEITYELTTVIVRTGSLASDPYTETAPFGLLAEVANEWTPASHPSVRRDLVHLMTGKDLDGTIIGIAKLDVVCVNGCMNGLSQSRWVTLLDLRAGLTAHELGHNWSAPHCDGNGRCFVMCSIIGACDGLGSPLRFGQPSIDEILAHRSTRTCLSPEPDPLASPFFEDWSSGTVDPTRWAWNDGAEASDLASSEPTPGFSVLLNAEGTGPGERDDLRTGLIDTRGASDLHVSFLTQHVGVEAGEELVVQVRNQADEIWVVLGRVSSDGVDQTEFTYHEFPFQANMYTDRFRLRFRVKTDEPDDHWFVDNVLVHDGPNLAQESLVRGAPFESVAHGVAPGDLVVFVASLTGAGALGSGAGPSLFGGALVLDVVPPLLNLGLVQADASAVARLSLTVPVTAPPGTTLRTQAVQLGSVLAASRTSNVVVGSVP